MARTQSIGWFLVGSMAWCAGQSVAGTINLNDTYNGGDPFVSDNYMWIDVLESNGAPADPAFNFYTDPQTVEDRFLLNPSNFRVQVNDDSATVTSALTMIIMGMPGISIPIVSFSESGDFEILGLAPNDAGVEASIDYTWEVLTGPPASGAGSVSFSESAAPNDSGIWNLDFSFVLPSDVSKLRFTFENRIMAEATVEGVAFIAKKLIDGVNVTVPEPAATFIALIPAIAWFLRAHFRVS